MWPSRALHFDAGRLDPHAEAEDAVDAATLPPFEAFTTAIAWAEGGPLQHPIKLALSQRFVHEGGCVHAGVAAPFEHGEAALHVVPPGERFPTARERLSRRSWAALAPLTGKLYYAPRDTLHVCEWNGGPPTPPALAAAVRGGNDLPDDAVLAVLGALLHELYLPAPDDEYSRDARWFEDRYDLHAAQTCRCVAPAVLCVAKCTGGAPHPYRAADDDGAGDVVDVLLPAASPVLLDEWAWPLVTARALHNESSAELFGVPPGRQRAVRAFVPVAREDVRRELDEDVRRGLDRLEARRRELRAVLDAGDAVAGSAARGAALDDTAARGAPSTGAAGTKRKAERS
jgi:hypothetical protein